MNDDSGPTVGDGFGTQHVAEQSAGHRSATIHHQYAAQPGLIHGFAHEGIVFATADCGGRPGKRLATAVIAEQRRDDAEPVAVLIAEVARGWNAGGSVHIEKGSIAPLAA